MSSKKRKYWNKLRNRYKLTIFNESTYEEVMHLRLSPLHVLTALSTLAVVLIILTIMLIAFTNLREFIPGYPSQQLRRQITQNALRVDSLLNEVQKKDRFLHSIQTILRDENLDTTSFVSMQQNVKVTYDTSMLGMSEEEAGFREIVEKEEKYNLTLGHVSSSDDDFYHFFSPLDGVVTNHFDETTRHYGVDLVAKPNLQLQIGDRLTVVGPEAAVTNVAKVLGNSLRRLREPNLVAIFLGIFLGILLGSIPFTFPGIPQPVKLGLAGGPLIISILISRFGPQYGLVTYTTMSANLMLREVGIALFLASVGLGAGDGFVETIIDGGGYAWIGYGFIITVVPLIIIGIIARTIYKVNYFTLMGLMAGSMTDPPALAYSNGIVGNDAPAVSYATVYPLTMFLRVLTAQMLILFFV